MVDEKASSIEQTSSSHPIEKISSSHQDKRFIQLVAGQTPKKTKTVRIESNASKRQMKSRQDSFLSTTVGKRSKFRPPYRLVRAGCTALVEAIDSASTSAASSTALATHGADAFLMANMVPGDLPRGSCCQ